MNLNHLIIPITIAVILILILVSRMWYVKAPPDRAYISGLSMTRRSSSDVRIRIPFFERMDRLLDWTDDGRYQDGTICSDK